MNGNNKKNIISTIHSVSNGVNTTDIIKTFDFGNDRYVAYLQNDTPSYIHFKKDKIGNYRFLNAEYESNYEGDSNNENTVNSNLQDFALPIKYKDDKLLPLKILVISNHYNTVSKLSVCLVNATGSTEKVEIKVGRPSAKIITLYKASNAFSIENRYYDEHGKQID
ncbi:hypothetical protein AN960_01875 [Bacillus sp. FJAT-25509]|uniref:hypothetical protein n=1 Tax=Bacillus sp. FJAT-25509 TaxID=1712029 RepID=UPI0006FF439D|nr:hypothetical protein [Bacillus sp. FJAT-25509]KQL42026.1 hypothetical protein AN960_01875 [Bacillus sp. FJAT-25509]